MIYPTSLPQPVAAAAGGSKAAKAAAKSAAKQDKRNAKLKEQRAAEAGAKKRVSELQVGAVRDCVYSHKIGAGHAACRVAWPEACTMTFCLFDVEIWYYGCEAAAAAVLAF
jgi:hypothetical protein